MTPSELRKLIGTKSNKDWYNSVEIHLSYPHVNLELDFKGIPSLYEFAKKQKEGWEKIEIPSHTHLQSSKDHFKDIEDNIIGFINLYSNREDENFDYYFSGYKNQIIASSKRNIFTYSAPETIFLINILKNDISKFKGAFAYMCGNLSENINSKDNFIGYLQAYEFTSKDYSQIVERKDKEKKAISTLRNDFQNSLPVLNQELIDHLKDSTDKYEEYVKIIDDFKTDKEKIYSDWFINTKGGFETFSKESDEKVKELEKVYNEKLKLEEPAKYWAERGQKLKKQGWIALTVLVTLVSIAVISLGELLWKVPEQIYNSFFEGDKSAAIRWSIIYVTFISFMAFCVKAVSKVMFSSFHLARDSEERYTLTYFYLALLKDAEVSKEEKQLIMQSLFSRADTGLLKEDSSPTMPNDIAGKLFNK